MRSSRASPAASCVSRFSDAIVDQLLPNDLPLQPQTLKDFHPHRVSALFLRGACPGECGVDATGVCTYASLRQQVGRRSTTGPWRQDYLGDAFTRGSAIRQKVTRLPNCSVPTLEEGSTGRPRRGARSGARRRGRRDARDHPHRAASLSSRRSPGASRFSPSPADRHTLLQPDRMPTGSTKVVRIC